MDVILFGAGKNLINNWYIFFAEHHNVLAVVDNCPGKKILPNGMPVRKPEVLCEYRYDAIFITLGRQKYVLEVLEQLRSMGANTANVWYLSNGKLSRLPDVKGIVPSKREKPYIFFEVTSMSRNDYGTGIQRTVKNFYTHVRSMYENVLPVKYFGEFITSREYEYQYGIRHGEYDGVEYKVDFQAGDQVFFPDTSWSIGISGEDFTNVHEKGARLCFVVYDLTPIRKQSFVAQIHYELFVEWIKAVFQHADSVVCISKAVADDMEKYYHEIGFYREKALPLYVNYLGYDIPQVHGMARKEMESFVKEGKTLLMVGTVQPLKNHHKAVEALKLVYKIRPDAKVQLLIIGKQHDLMKDFDDILSEAEITRDKIRWIKDANDEEVAWAYRNCAALLYPSQAEGFGLPLVEASYFNLPILCSDIPVFREIAGKNAIYFAVNNVKAMADVILHWADGNINIDSCEIECRTWQESAEGIVRILQEKEMPYKILA